LYNPFKKKYISHFKDPLLENAMLTDNEGQESPVVCVNDPTFRYTHVEFSPSVCPRLEESKLKSMSDECNDKFLLSLIRMLISG
jgi:methionine salvage enolase-phosphatase E1